MMSNKRSLIITLLLAGTLFLVNCSSAQKAEEGAGDVTDAAVDTATDKAKEELAKRATGICEKGDCKNGEGTMVYPDGNKYEGTFKEGKFDGKGKFTFFNGDVYEGDFVGDKFEGKGVYSFNGGDKYSGDFKSDALEGKGAFDFKDGHKYNGDFKANKFDGQGELVSKGGSKYNGGFADNKFNGNGKLTDSTGKVIYEGEWDMGAKKGQ
ncbi:MAG: hypothetical protein KDK45_06875 [Leptospiraceae bacterium]|nr:hypothetical protein [Leptospiraceae bacterium]